MPFEWCAVQAELEQDLRSATEAVNKAEQLAGLPLTKFDSPGMRSSRCAFPTASAPHVRCATDQQQCSQLFKGHHWLAEQHHGWLHS
jgi:hypothetical protein